MVLKIGARWKEGGVYSGDVTRGSTIRRGVDAGNG